MTAGGRDCPHRVKRRIVQVRISHDHGKLGDPREDGGSARVFVGGCTGSLPNPRRIRDNTCSLGFSKEFMDSCCQFNVTGSQLKFSKEFMDSRPIQTMNDRAPPRMAALLLGTGLSKRSQWRLPQRFAVSAGMSKESACHHRAHKLAPGAVR